MKQNPCRYCALSYESKGRRYPSFRDECCKCEHQKKHKAYLMSQRTYEHGEVITSLEELLNQTLVFWKYRETPIHIEVIKNWQLRIVFENLENGGFYKAIKKNMEE